MTIDITGIVESTTQESESEELGSDIPSAVDQLKSAQARNIDANTRNTDVEIVLKRDLADKTLESSYEYPRKVLPSESGGLL